MPKLALMLLLSAAMTGTLGLRTQSQWQVVHAANAKQAPEAVAKPLGALWQLF